MNDVNLPRTATYEIDVNCANCAALMEVAAAKVSGVSAVSVSFLTGRMIVTFDPDADEKKVMKAVLKACRRVEPDCHILF